MGFNYEKEKLLFEAEWKKLAAEYSEAGLDALEIQAMRGFDWKWFCQRRTYENRTQSLPSEVIDNSNDESRSTLLRRFPSLTDNFDEGSFISRLGWIDDITDPVLLDKLAKLSDSDIELLTLFVFDGYTQAEIAAIQGCSQQSVSKKIRRIKIFLQ